MTLEKVADKMGLKLDYTVNVATLVGGIAFLFALGGAWASINSRVGQLEATQTQTAASITQRNALYEPKIEALQTSNTIQDERIAGLGIASREAAKVNNEILIRLGTIREDIAGIKAQLSIRNKD